MSGKVLHSLTDENPDLHKQVGCMNGMFQVFNRRHFLTGRRIGSRDNKRLPPVQSGNHGMEPDSTMQKTMEMNLDEVVKEKRRVSIESSRTSFSSSCSSTFSSVDWNKTAKPEPSSLGYSNFLETPSQILPKKQPISPLHPRQQSLNLLDVVKDSITREACGLSVKTTTKAERTNHVLKHIDSPRPLQPSKPVKARVSGLDGSFPLKDTHRYSYDGRESRDTWKAAIKLKETPRLSLDSRQSSIRRSASESRSNYLLDDLERRNVKSSQTLDPPQEPGSNNRRTSGVVAKLMGLEDFPDSMAAINDQIRMTECCPDEDLDAMSTTSRKVDESKHNQVSRSPRTQRTPSPAPQLRSINAIVKPHTAFPLEPAPWRKTDGNGGSGKPASMFCEAQVQRKEQNLHPSLYGEIEKRLTEIEFKRSGKDLRALKQILDAMQTARESSKDASGLEPHTRNHSTDYRKLDQNSMSRLDCSQQSIHLTNPIIKGIGPLKNFESSGIFIKQAKVVQKTRNSRCSVIPIEGMPGLRKLRTNENANNGRNSVEKRSPNNLTPRNSHFREPYCQPLCSMDKRSNATICKQIQTSKSPQNKSRDDATSSGRSSSTASPRLQQKQHGMEKQSCSTTKISDSRRSRKHLGKQQIESSSPSTKGQQKSLIELSTETRQCDAISVQSESNISLTSEKDVEITSIDSSNKIYGAYQHEGPRSNIEARLTEDRSKAETTTATLEQPSPVSVLDTTFYREGSPSPIKKTSNAFKDESQDFDEAEWNPEDLQDLLNNKGSKPGIDFGREQSVNIKHLVHKLGQVNSKQDEPATDYVSSLCENTNPEHKYIVEILLASRLLFKDLVSSSAFIQLHPSGNLINPKLFFVLEQTKRRIGFSDDECTNEKIDHRKLIFDTVNEILVRKLSPAGYSEPWICPSNMGVKRLTGHKLLKEVCSEVDQLQARPNCSIHDEDDGSRSILSEDMVFQTLNWEDCHSEIPGLVLDIERMIFKDLISEVVSGEVAGHPGRPAVHCKRLFY
ncbi:protein LONGIFOLIA 2-like [Rhododendron vialii]|uniref:protein LONGIFOLIA 2-like n=1 Tax=Rhododendron vialii TaxID=182163 RepID=UPI00265EDB8E|nr:protein LONGIFOLIA 2-like [Rhododendron vialii]